MKTKSLFALFAIVMMSTVHSQTTSPTAPVTNKNVVRINLLGVPGFGFEKGIGGFFTFRPEAGFGWPVITREKNAAGKNEITIESIVNPYLLLEGRYYYNMQKRFDMGKKTDNYSANYLAYFYRYNAYEYQAGFSENNQDSSDVLLRDVQYLGLWWGMQRNLGTKQRFYINFSIGPGLKTNWKDYANFTMTSQLGLGLQW